MAKQMTEQDGERMKELTSNSENKKLYLKVTMEFLLKYS
jgi:hypothetical protein